MSNQKFELREGLNKKGKELLKYAEIFYGLSENDDMQPVLKYYIENQLSYSCVQLGKYENIIELKSDLMLDKKYLMTKKEQMDEAIPWAMNILDFSRLKISAKTNGKTEQFIITKMIGIYHDDLDKIFETNWRNFTQNKLNEFMQQFLDLYVMKNLKSYLASFNPILFDFDFGESYNTRNYYGFNLNFVVSIHNLDEKVLTEIGSILSSLPSFL